MVVPAQGERKRKWAALSRGVALLQSMSDGKLKAPSSAISLDALREAWEGSQNHSRKRQRPQCQISPLAAENKVPLIT
jgi:hypothetical protein